MNVRYLDVAEQELDDAFDWYENQVEGLGRHLVEELRLATRRITIFSKSCQEVAPGVRR